MMFPYLITFPDGKQVRGYLNTKHIVKIETSTLKTNIGGFIEMVTVTSVGGVVTELELFGSNKSGANLLDYIRTSKE